MEISRVSRDEGELEEAIKRSLKNPQEGQPVEGLMCYPIADGCCIKKGAT